MIDPLLFFFNLSTDIMQKEGKGESGTNPAFVTLRPARGPRSLILPLQITSPVQWARGRERNLREQRVAL